MQPSEQGVVDPDAIRENLSRVQEKIEAATRRAGRDTAQVKLVVVSKTKPVELIRAALDAGATRFGENYADQAVPKIELLKNEPEIQWHMIGHVQSRKARLVCEHFDYLHSLDSLKLAEKLSTLCQELNRSLPVLIECNLAGEESKSGWQVTNPAEEDSLTSELESILSLPGLSVQGLMTMPPLSEDLEQTRRYFCDLVRLRDRLAKRFPAASFGELSMGTSADYETAIESGATFVRVGQAILGPRIYPIE